MLGRSSPQPRGKAKQAASEDPDLEVLLMLPDPQTPVAQQVAAAWRQALGENFQRTPPQVFAALLFRQQNPSAPTAPTLVPPAPTAPAEAATSDEEEEEPKPPAMSPLAAHVVSGNWKVVKELIASLPLDQRTPAYSTLLAVLAGDAKGVVLPQDVPALIDMSPAPLNDRQLANLGALLKRSLEQSERPAALLTSLKLKQLVLGADEMTQSMAVAKLLLAAGLLDEAKEYLPPLADSPADADAALISLHARYQLLLARRTRDDKALAQSWRLTLEVLERSEIDPLSRAMAIRRVLALAPAVSVELAGPWFRSVLGDDSPLGLALLTEIGQMAAMSFQTNDQEGRQSALHLHHLLGTQLLADGNSLSPRSSVALEMLSRAWVNEAQKGIGGGMRKIRVEEDQKISPLPLPLLLAAAPDHRWRKALASDTAEHVLHLTSLLAVRTGQTSHSLGLIKELVSGNPQLAGEIATELLERDVRMSEDDEDLDMHFSAAQRRAMQGWSNRRRHSPVQTRAGQLRDLVKLTELIAAIRATGVPPLKEQSLVAAFSNCHSPAEVYLESDIAKVFGPIDQIGPDAALPLATSLRQGLAGQWRDPSMQQRQGTKRTPQDQVQEIMRGYALTLQLLNEAVQRSPERVDLRLLLAGAYFDEAEFLYGQEADLATYARERDAAFRHFQAAADAYARTVAELEPEKYDVEPYQLWFQAALGASDLAYLTRQDEPDKTQVERVAAALRSLPATAVTKHLEAFATSLVNSLDQVPPPLKPHFVRQGLKVVGEETGRPLAHRLAYYDELLKEVELHLAVDGDPRVGHGRPFGVHVSLLGTRAVARENDTFSELLIPSGQGQFGLSSGESDARRRLEQELKEKLSEAFTIESLAFHTPQTTPRTAGREGWLALPVAYAILRAKDPSVDRLAALQLDLEFSDGSSQVRLPVRSPVAAIDCRDDNPPQRPVREVKIRQLLDDRQLSAGVLRLEISATALGVVPELDQLVNADPTQASGFETTRVTSQELSIASLNANELVEAHTERRWLVELSPAGAAAHQASFNFPSPVDPASAVTYQRYADVDIVDTTASTALAWPMVAGVRRWLWPAIGGAVLLAVLLLAVVLARRRATTTLARPSYRQPDQVTPFAVISLLRRMQQDHSLPLTAAERQSLRETLEELDEHFFVRNAPQNGLDLEPICRRWIERAAG
jgi:hypothetical protein